VKAWPLGGSGPCTLQLAFVEKLWSNFSGVGCPDIAARRNGARGIAPQVSARSFGRQETWCEGVRVRCLLSDGARGVYEPRLGGAVALPGSTDPPESIPRRGSVWTSADDSAREVSRSRTISSVNARLEACTATTTEPARKN